MPLTRRATHAGTWYDNQGKGTFNNHFMVKQSTSIVAKPYIFYQMCKLVEEFEIRGSTTYSRSLKHLIMFREIVGEDALNSYS